MKSKSNNQNVFSFFIIIFFGQLLQTFSFSKSLNPSYNHAVLNNNIPQIAPEISSSTIKKVTQFTSKAIGDANDDDHVTISKTDRYASARKAASDYFPTVKGDEKIYEHSMKEITMSDLVYGELSVPVLARLFNAVGINPNENVLDIGSGDGALVLGSSLLLATKNKNNKENDSNWNYIKKVTGIEIVPGLYHRSLKHGHNFQNILREEDKKYKSNESNEEQKNKNHLSIHNMAKFQFILGDIYKIHTDPKIQSIVSETTLAVCFATTWSAGNANIDSNTNIDSLQNLQKRTSLQQRLLPELSSALSFLPKGARAVIIDGKLNPAQDGFTWHGELKIECPDTAPYSIASLYEKI